MHINKQVISFPLGLDIERYSNVLQRVQEWKAHCEILLIVVRKLDSFDQTKYSIANFTMGNNTYRRSFGIGGAGNIRKCLVATGYERNRIPNWLPIANAVYPMQEPEKRQSYPAC